LIECFINKNANAQINGAHKTVVCVADGNHTYIIERLNSYNRTGQPLGSLLGKYKNVVVVDVLGSSHYDWSDPNNGKEIKDPKWKTGYAIYMQIPINFNTKGDFVNYPGTNIENISDDALIYVDGERYTKEFLNELESECS
jgi:hypothetical protein